MTHVDDYLTKLFRRAQNAVSRGGDPHTRLPLSPAQFPTYHGTRDFQEAQEYRAQLILAERKGAIKLHLNHRFSAPRDIDAVSVANLKALAEHLHLPLRVEQLSNARMRLSEHIETFSIIKEIISLWEKGKKVRGQDANESTLTAIHNAINVMLTRRAASDDVMLRRESIRLFNDSKRIEALGNWLDVLLHNDLRPSGLSDIEIFSALGLQKEPQPFLICADAVAKGAEISSCLFHPYHGLPMANIVGFEFEAAPRCVLSIENKQTFHEFSALATNTDVCVVYTGGMPSPSWLQTYAKLLDAIPLSVPIYHFGDLDVGGFRIANVIAQTVRTSERSLLPWLMDPVLLSSGNYILNTAAQSVILDMQRFSRMIGWESIADNFDVMPGVLEQETVNPILPA